MGETWVGEHLAALHSKLKVQMNCEHFQVGGRFPVDTLWVALKERSARRLEMGKCFNFLNGVKSWIRKETIKQITKWRWKLGRRACWHAFWMQCGLISAGCLDMAGPLTNVTLKSTVLMYLLSLGPSSDPGHLLEASGPLSLWDWVCGHLLSPCCMGPHPLCP